MAPNTGSEVRSSHSLRTYLPAAGRDWLLPFYDPIVKLLGGDAARKALVEQARLQPGQRVLEIGCGTGTLDIMMKRLHPEVEVVGIDPDSKALTRSRRKAARAGVWIHFDQGFGDELPYPDGSFDRVFSSFVFHHLPAIEKETMLRAARRVLKSGGELHLLDFEASEHHGHGIVWRLAHSSERLKDNAESQVLNYIRGAGFREAAKVGRRKLLSGKIAYYRAIA